MQGPDIKEIIDGVKCIYRECDCGSERIIYWWSEDNGLWKDEPGCDICMPELIGVKPIGQIREEQEREKLFLVNSGQTTILEFCV